MQIVVVYERMRFSFSKTGAATTAYTVISITTNSFRELGRQLEFVSGPGSMLSAIRLYAQRGICIDSTLAVRSHNWKMLTWLLLGPHGIGVPVATLFATKDNSKILKAFLHEIEHRLGNHQRTLHVHSFLRNDCPAYFLSLSKAFGAARRLLCSLHVKQAGKTKLKKFLHTKLKAPQGKRARLLSKLPQIHKQYF